MFRWLLQWWQGRKAKPIPTPYADEAVVAVAVALQPSSAPENQNTPPENTALTPEKLEEHINTFLGADRLAALHALARPSLSFKLEALASDDRAISKVGGAPYWPKTAWGSTPYPTDQSGKPLAFLAQINCSELPAGLSQMPKHGMLQFYIANNDLYGCNIGGDLAEPDNFRVIYWPSTLHNSYEASIVEGDSLPHHPNRPARMLWGQVTQQPVSSASWHFQRILGVDAWQQTEAFCKSHSIQHDRFFDALHERFLAAGHRIGGHPQFTQSDIRADDSIVSLKKYELLFQLDTDDDAKILWGDAGIGNFFITDDALSKRDFTQVLYTWDCS